MVDIDHFKILTINMGMMWGIRCAYGGLQDPESKWQRKILSFWRRRITIVFPEKQPMRAVCMLRIPENHWQQSVRDPQHKRR